MADKPVEELRDPERYLSTAALGVTGDYCGLIEVWIHHSRITDMWNGGTQLLKECIFIDFKQGIRNLLLDLRR